MLKFRFFLTLFAFTLSAVPIVGAAAQQPTVIWDPSRLTAPSLAEERAPPYTSHLSSCAAQEIVDAVAARFADTESTYWNSPLKILTFNAITELGFRPHGPQYIPRRYCSAIGAFNDGQTREVVYNIVSDSGFLSIGQGIEWCVVGLDRSHAYSPNCRQAGP